MKADVTDETAIEIMRKELYPQLDNGERAYVEAALREPRDDAEAFVEALLEGVANIQLQVEGVSRVPMPKAQMASLAESASMGLCEVLDAGSAALADAPELDCTLAEQEVKRG